MKKFLKNYFIEIIFLFFAIVFSFWLMRHTFSYKEGSMMIATKVWSDFASHISLIRSFSFGQNFPPEYPLFSGPPIRYHFLFYALVGLLEKLGLRIDLALNIPSALGFVLLLIMIFIFAKLIFKKSSIAALSCIFFLFNGSLSFLDFLKQHPLPSDVIHQIITNTIYPSFNPYGPGIVSAFWNLNIYTNQRHLAPSLAFSLLIIFSLMLPIFSHHNLSKKVYLFSGILLGLFFYFHTPVLVMTEIVLLVILILFPKIRLQTFLIILISLLLAIPQYFFYLNGFPFKMASQDIEKFSIIFKPGYLISNNLTIINFLSYWIYNLGLHFYLIIIGIIWLSHKIKKLFLCFFTLFLAGNLFQFSTEMAANHKFFNLFMIFGVMISSFVIVALWNYKTFSKILAVLLSAVLIISGVIDFFPIYNDVYVTINDYPKNLDTAWFMKHTSKNSVFLNTNYLYDSASLAGRKIFYGWPYFAWSQGFNTFKRHSQIRAMLNDQNPRNICNFLVNNNIDYVSLTKTSEDFPYNQNFWNNTFTAAYQSSNSDLKIYNTKDICSLGNL